MPKSMKITKVTPLMLDRYLCVTVETDAGITGLGESGAWGFLEASQAAVEKFGRDLVGQDPLRIEHHWQDRSRFSHFRGAAIMGALSALDIAPWDIAGKHFGVPVYQLLGGQVRDRAAEALRCRTLDRGQHEAGSWRPHGPRVRGAETAAYAGPTRPWQTRSPWVGHPDRPPG